MITVYRHEHPNQIIMFMHTQNINKQNQLGDILWCKPLTLGVSADGYNRYLYIEKSLIKFSNPGAYGKYPIPEKLKTSRFENIWFQKADRLKEYLIVLGDPVYIKNLSQRYGNYAICNKSEVELVVAFLLTELSEAPTYDQVI